MEIGAKHSLLERWVEANGGGLDEVAHAELVTEACKTRPHLCGSMLAYWEAQSPGAAGIAERQAALLRMRPFSAHVAPGRFDMLASFHRNDPSGPPLAPTDALRLTNVFADYYHHGIGFRRELLDAIWARCTDADDGECARQRKRAERRVGPIAAPPAPG
jgi:hypothetical protein